MVSNIFAYYSLQWLKFIKVTKYISREILHIYLKTIFKKKIVMILHTIVNDYTGTFHTVRQSCTYLGYELFTQADDDVNAE